MRRFLSLIILLVIVAIDGRAGYVSPQRCAYDSLVSVSKSSEIGPAEKIVVFLQLAEVLRDSIPDRSFSYVIEAYRLSAQENSIPGKAKARRFMGDYFSSKRLYNLALENYLGSMRLYSLLSDTAGLIQVIGQVALIHQNIQKYQYSAELLKQAVGLAIKSKDNLSAGQFLEQIAISYELQKNLDTSLFYFIEARRYYELANFPYGIGSIANNMGGLLLDQRKYPEALEHYNKVLKDYQHLGDYFLGTIYTRIGHIYSETGDHRSSLRNNILALQARVRAHKNHDINSSIINIAGDYYMLGKLDSAEKYMDQGLRVARYFHRRMLIENAYRRIYDYYYMKGDYVKALQYYEMKSAERDTIMLENNSSSVALIDATQRYTRILQANAMLVKQNERQVLNIRKQTIQSVFVEVITGLAAITVLIVMIQFLYNRLIRRNMQHLNENLNLEMWERRETQKQTRLREEQFRFIMENSLDVVTRVNKEFRHIFASPSSQSLFGFTNAEMLAITPYEVIHPDFHEYTARRIDEMLESRLPTELVYPARKKDGGFLWVESILNPIFDHKTGEYKELVAVTRDIQDRKTKEMEIMEGTKQKENLLKEIHHRVKNNFAILVSLINMQKDQTRNPELLQSLTNLQLRIRSMSLVHEMLYRSSDFEKISFTDYLHSLASVIAGTYNRRDIKLNIEAQEAVIDIETSIPLGLIVNEILSNSYKHGFPDGRSGKIGINLINDSKSPVLDLVFSDDGIGLQEGFNIENCKTMGLQIVNILVRQIDGSLIITNDPGATFKLSFPKITV
jgi:PAS domain S-box-containing protein